jgi:glycosyltransferase involved in cell wall biosynthesis
MDDGLTTNQEPDLGPWSSYPSGTAEDWIERYQPLVREVLERDAPDSPALSVIVVAWNSAKLVVEALDVIRVAAERCVGPVEIILVDNGGLDSVRSELQARVHQMIRMVGNVRLCRARNLGAARARGPVLVFLDDDGLVQEEHLANVERWFTKQDTCAVRGRLVHKNHRYFTTLAEHYDLGAEALEDCLVTEGNMAIRREAYISAGGFNETLAGNEGVDLTYRLKREDPDAVVLYVPDVVLRHDFMDGWPKFRRKFSHYAGMDRQLTEIDPALGPFLKKYQGTPRPRRRLAADERLARWFLTKLKKRLQRRARKAARRA